MLKMLKMRTQKKVRSMIKKTCIFLEKYLNCHKQNFGGIGILKVLLIRIPEKMNSM